MGYFPVRYDSRVVIYEHKMIDHWMSNDEVLRVMPKTGSLTVPAIEVSSASRMLSIWFLPGITFVQETSVPEKKIFVLTE